MKKFVICGTQRTGTSLLDSSLNAHPSIRCYSEVFLFSKGRGGKIEGSYRKFLNKKPLARKVGDIINRSSLVEQYLDELFVMNNAQATGFKLMLGQIKKFPSIADYLRSHDVSAIHIVRENVLKTYISRLTAKKRKLYHVKNNVKVEKVCLPITKLQRELGLIELENEQWKHYLTKVQTIEVHYEDILKDRAELMTEVQEFIGVDCETDLPSQLTKINPDTLEDVIENYEQVKQALSGSAYEKHLS